MTDGNNKGPDDVGGSEAEEKTSAIQGHADELAAAAVITGLPDKAFFKSFTARRRREIVYHVDSRIEGFAIRLEVHGSGMMTALVTTQCVAIEDGRIDHRNDEHRLAWAHNGQEAVLRTRLDHNHLQEYPQADNVMRAFLEAIGTQTNAVCAGGFAQWRMVMQLMADRIGRERGTAIELVALLPLPTEQTGSPTRGPTDFEIFDIGDADEPALIKGYEDELRQIDETMTPEGVTLMLLAPGYLVCRRHREIFSSRWSTHREQAMRARPGEPGFAARGTANL